VELTGNRLRRRDLSGLLSTRQGTLATALICAVVAAGVIVLAINRYKHSVSSSSSQATVLVATRLIQKGTTGDAVASEQLFSPTRILQKQVTTGALADTALLHGKVATADIYPGQQLTAADFAPAGGIASRLTPSERAISVPVDQPHGMVGTIASGDHVDVYGSYQGQNAAGAVVRLLASDVLVLDAPTSTSGSIGGQQSATAVLAGPPKLDAELAFTADNGKVWLVLRPGNASASGQSAATISSILTSVAGDAGQQTTAGAKP
jgi:Flp pilus assembly protein CpaB